MKTQYIKNHIGLLIAITLFFYLTSVTAYFVYNDHQDDHLIFDDSKVITMEEGTTVLLEDGQEKTVLLPTAVETKEPFSLLLDLSSYGNLEGKSISLLNNYTNLRVIADGREIYQYVVSEDALVKSGGYLIHFFDIPENLEDKTIVIQMTPLLSAINEQKLAQVFLGKKSDIVLYHALKDIPIAFFGLTLFFIFFIVLIISGFKKSFAFQDRDTTLHVGLISFLLSIYFICQLWTVNYLLSNYHIGIYFFEYGSLANLILPVIILLKGKLNPVFDRLFTLCIVGTIVNVVLQFGLMVFQVAEFKEMLPVTHGILLASAITVVVSFVFTKGKDYPEKFTLGIAVLPLIIGFILALANYFITGMLLYPGLFTFFVLAFYALQVKRASKRYIDLQASTIKNEIYKEMALVDSMTGLPNRTAYSMFLQEREDSDQSGWIVSMDLNQLKYINDTYGHQTGDDLITVFSNLLKENAALIPEAECFRIGGDEFVTFIPKEESYEVEQWVHKIVREADAVVFAETPMALHFAYGFYYHRAGGAESLEEAVGIADKKMYQNKAVYKNMRVSKIFKETNKKENNKKENNKKENNKKAMSEV